MDEDRFNEMQRKYAITQYKKCKNVPTITINGVEWRHLMCDLFINANGDRKFIRDFETFNNAEMKV